MECGVMEGVTVTKTTFPTHSCGEQPGVSRQQGWGNRRIHGTRHLSEEHDASVSSSPTLYNMARVTPF